MTQMQFSVKKTIRLLHYKIRSTSCKRCGKLTRTVKSSWLPCKTPMRPYNSKYKSNTIRWEFWKRRPCKIFPSGKSNTSRIFRSSKLKTRSLNYSSATWSTSINYFMRRSSNCKKSAKSKWRRRVPSKASILFLLPVCPSRPERRRN